MNAVYAQIARGFRQAANPTTGAGLVCTWGGVEFHGIQNAVDPLKDGVDLNPGDDTPTYLSALVEDFPGGVLPAQGDTIEIAGKSHRVVAITREPSRPIAHFRCANAYTLPVPPPVLP